MALKSRVLNAMRLIADHPKAEDGGHATTQLLLSGKMMAEIVKSRTEIRTLTDVEFKVFSQFGDDGILQWLTANLDIPNKTFVEFGVEDYRESNTRFLMMNDNWSGLVIDGSRDNVSKIVNSEYYWKYDLTAKAAFIDRENINSLLSVPGMNPEVGILSVDLDGNDYWILQEITAVKPIIVIVEYNAVFGLDRALTIPYDAKFRRTVAHHSNLYWGASLRAFAGLCEKNGFAFVGCNGAGNNAYFVRRDKLNNTVHEVSLDRGFVTSKFRDSRDQGGRLTYLTGDRRLAEIRGMKIFNLDSGQLESL